MTARESHASPDELTSRPSITATTEPTTDPTVLAISAAGYGNFRAAERLRGQASRIVAKWVLGAANLPAFRALPIQTLDRLEDAVPALVDASLAMVAYSVPTVAAVSRELQTRLSTTFDSLAAEATAWVEQRLGAAEHGGRGERSVTTPDGSAANAATVVIIEDQQAIAELLCDVLLDAGFAPIWAPSAQEAASVARDLDADVVLLDVMMPERSGWSVLEELRADPATHETPVVIISAVYDRPGLHSLPAGGPIRFAAKPFDIADLVETVAALTA